MSLRDRVERYVALKRHLGWKFVNNPAFVALLCNLRHGVR